MPTTSDISAPKILSENLFPVVGIGASAGGLDAFKKLVSAIPENSGMAYNIVQHLHPEHNSALPEILQLETKLPVHEICNNIKVAPNNIYIIPENKMLTATDGVLQLSPRPSRDKKNMPIDIFFTSLADVHQDHAIGVVLSGTGADGTMGLLKIKDHGGITIAQDPGDAAYDEMPQSAIRAEAIDFVIAAHKIPQHLLELNKTFNRPAQEDMLTAGQLTEQESYRQVLALLRLRHGADFTYYKQSTINRRILRRMALLKIDKIIDYQEHLKQDKGEQDLLFQDLLIPVTSFFRDTKTFENLAEHVFPKLIKDVMARNHTAANGSTNALRIWVAGCSTGEEAYSISMCLCEYLEGKDYSFRIQIFATDLSEQSIAKARMGFYDKKQIEGVSEDRLKLFFTKNDGHYQVKKSVRDMCVFATHNFLKDPPFAKIDFLSCRNVLIYLEPYLQKRAFSTFHYSLNDKGLLLLGKSETIGSSAFFAAVGNKEKLYTRVPVASRFRNMRAGQREEGGKEKEAALKSNVPKTDDFQKNADEVLLSRFAPAGVVVNELFDIVQFRGSTREFLEPSPGKPSLNVLKMAREGLSFELRNALQKSKASGEAFTKQGIPIANGKQKNSVSIEVIPLLNTPDLHFLILFKEDEQAAISSRQLAAANGQAPQINEPDAREIRITQLEKELVQAREDMRNITEDQKAAYEELQSANEELLSGSEELQSLNEELETSKEELQSTNEELMTINQELYDRNELYNHAKLYAEAIVTTIHEPLLVISKDFSIKSANQSFYNTFQVTEAEAVGKVLFELQNHGWDIPDLRRQLTIIQTGRKQFLEW